MWQQLLTIARNTFTESIRQPIFTVLVSLGGLVLAMMPMLAAYSLESGDGDNKMLIDLAMSTIFLTGLLLAAFTASGVLSEEVENKTVLTVVSKPVPRPVFVAGKFLGVAGAIAIAYWTLSLIFVLTFRHGVMQTARHEFDQPVLLFGLLGAAIAVGIAGFGNYFYRKVFNSTFILSLAVAETIAVGLVLMLSKDWALQSPLHEFTKDAGMLGQISLGLVMVFEAVMLLTAVAITCSTRLGQVMTLVVCTGLFLLGVVSNSFSQLISNQLSLPRSLGIWESFAAIFQAEVHFAMKLLFMVAHALYLAVPNLQFLWPADAITQGHEINVTHVVTLTGYAMCYLIAILSLAVILFQRREVG